MRHESMVVLGKLGRYPNVAVKQIKDDEVGAKCGLLHAEFCRCSTETGYLFEVIDLGRRSCRLDLNPKAVRGRGLIMRLSQRTGQFRADTSILFTGYYGGPCRHEL